MIHQAIANLQKQQIVPDHVNFCLPLTGGTNSKVYSLGTESNPHQYVIKFNTKEQIEQEVSFYERYRHVKLLPRIVFVDQSFSYFVYTFIPGQIMVNRGSKLTWMKQLIDQFIVHYNKIDIQTTDVSKFSIPEQPETMKQSMNWCASVIGDHLTEGDHELIKRIYERRKNHLLHNETYVLHGDLGVHNLLFEQGEIKGIIDPIPSIGRRVYELLYAFCSSPDDLSYTILKELCERLQLPISNEELVEDFMLALYSRIGTCITYHPKDLPSYVHAWNEWKSKFISIS